VIIGAQGGEVQSGFAAEGVVDEADEVDEVDEEVDEEVRDVVDEVVDDVEPVVVDELLVLDAVAEEVVALV